MIARYQTVALGIIANPDSLNGICHCHKFYTGANLQIINPWRICDKPISNWIPHWCLLHFSVPWSFIRMNEHAKWWMAFLYIANAILFQGLFLIFKKTSDITHTFKIFCLSQSSFPSCSGSCMLHFNAL